MSRAKAELDYREAHHHRRIRGHYVCAECIGDPALAGEVAALAEVAPCGYCARSDAGGVAADVNEVLDFMIECVSFEYRSEAEESVPWDSAEGGWLIRPMTLAEILRDHAGDSIPDAMRDDVEESLLDAAWFERDAMALRPHDQLIYSWTTFAEIVRDSRRRVMQPRVRQRSHDLDLIPPDEILTSITRTLEDFPDVIVELGRSTPIWRARHSGPAGYRDVSKLGPPPRGRSSRGGRMNPPGKAWFYGALEPTTARIEARKAGGSRWLTVAPFYPTRNLRVLDLTGCAVALPSIFDPDRHSERVAARFVADFAKDISRPVDPGRTSEYAGTQLTTEYLRTQFNAGGAIDGIIYPSSKKRDGRNVVLFVERGHCGNESETSSSTVLRLANSRIDVVPA